MGFSPILLGLIMGLALLSQPMVFILEQQHLMRKTNGAGQPRTMQQ
jgi:hypothetical protein